MTTYIYLHIFTSSTTYTLLLVSSYILSLVYHCISYIPSLVYHCILYISSMRSSSSMPYKPFILITFSQNRTYTWSTQHVHHAVASHSLYKVLSSTFISLSSSHLSLQTMLQPLAHVNHSFLSSLIHSLCTSCHMRHSHLCSYHLSHQSIYCHNFHIS